MDRHQYYKKWSKIGLISGIATLALVFFLIILVVRPMSIRRASLENSISDSRQELNKLRSVTQSIADYRTRKEEAVDITNRLVNYVVFKGTETEQFSNALKTISESSGMNLDEVEFLEENREGAVVKQRWGIGFKADSQSILNFIRNTETFSNFMGVEKLSIKSGGREKLHKATMTVYNITGVNPSEITLAEDIQELSLTAIPERVLLSVEELITLTEYRDAKTDIDEDPLYFGHTLFRQRPQQQSRPRQVARPPRLVLDGILWDESDPLAVINGEVIREGESIRGATLERVSRSYVLLRWRTQYIRLQID